MDTPTILSPLIDATILADSISDDGVRLTTMELIYPRFIHAELMTHRVFSRNASSSRAIPVKRALKMIRENPAVPASWRMNQAGMQGYEFASTQKIIEAQSIWLEAMEAAIGFAERMDATGIHKQVVNRICEPYSHIKVVVTSVYWDNWFGLRDHPAADPTIAALAAKMKTTMDVSEPTPLARGEWHLPYISATERSMYREDILVKISAARCARVSYNNHDGTATDPVKDLELHDRLLVDQPIHASPAEHQAKPDSRDYDYERDCYVWRNPELHGNLTGWQQYRKTLLNENIDKLHT